MNPERCPNRLGNFAFLKGKQGFLEGLGVNATTGIAQVAAVFGRNGINGILPRQVSK